MRMLLLLLVCFAVVAGDVGVSVFAVLAVAVLAGAGGVEQQLWCTYAVPLSL